MQVELKVAGIDGVLATLQALPAEVVSKSGGPVKAALRAGARVLLREAALNLARSTGNLSADEDTRRSTGLLLKNLIASRGKAPIGGNGERYLVRVRSKSYPDRKGEITTTLKTAQLLEYGSSQQPAEPWLRPAFAAKAEQAITTTQTELVKGVDRVVARLARQNAGR